MNNDYSDGYLLTQHNKEKQMKLLPRNETELRLYSAGYLDGKVNGYSNLDGDYWYKRGYDAGVADYCDQGDANG